MKSTIQVTGVRGLELALARSFLKANGLHLADAFHVLALMCLKPDAFQTLLNTCAPLLRSLSSAEVREIVARWVEP